MADRKRTYNTYNKLRFALFTNSYAGYSIKQILRDKYKIHNKLTTKQLKKQFGNKIAIPEISKLSKTLHFDYNLLWRFIILDIGKRICISPRDKYKIKAFLGIESEIVSLIIARQDQDSLIQEDYDRALLAPAIERAAGNHLCNIKNDRLFNTKLEELQSKYQRWYYFTAYKYKLPTPRIIPFILRLTIY